MGKFLFAFQCSPADYYPTTLYIDVDCVWNVMAHVQKPDFVFWLNGQVHLNRRGRQFSRLLAAELCASAVVMVVMLDTPCSEVVWRILATHSIRQFPLHFPFRASPCAITFQLDSTTKGGKSCPFDTATQKYSVPLHLWNINYVTSAELQGHDYDCCITKNLISVQKTLQELGQYSLLSD
jgi:hypothetical protein